MARLHVWLQFLACLTVFLCAAFLCAAERSLAQVATGMSDRDETNAEIEQQLDQKRDMVFEDATLEEIATFLESVGIPAQLDTRALDEMGIGTDSPLITFRQHAIRLRDGLRFALASHDVVATPRRGRLVISTAEAEQDPDRLITTVYDVRNLVELVPFQYWSGSFGSGEMKTAYQYDFDALIELITRTVQPDSWDDVGGPGAIEPYYTRRMRAIVVSQSYEVHRRIQALLDSLAELGGATPLPGLAPVAPSQVAASQAAPAEQPARTYVRSSAGQSPPARIEIRTSRLRTTGQ